MSTKSEQGLMSKKKAELIDIILRKDDVERELRKELDATKLDFDKAKKMSDTYKDDRDKYKTSYETECKISNEYQDVIDNLTSDITEDNIIIKKQRIAIVILSIALTVSIVLGIVL